MGDADAEMEPAAGYLVNVGSLMGKFFGRLRIDRRDRCSEGDTLCGKRQTQALDHVAELARDGDAGKAALLDLACDVEGPAPMTWLRDEIEGGEWFGHHYTRKPASDGRCRNLSPLPSAVIAVTPVGSVLICLARDH